MPSVSITSLGNDSVEVWKTPWVAQREKMVAESSIGGEVATDAPVPVKATAPEAPLDTRGRRRLMIWPGAFAMLTLLLIGSREGRVLELFFPAGALVVGALLYKRSPPHYLSFVVWLFFLVPEVRRLSDYFNDSFSERSLIMVAPVATAMLCCVAVATHLPVLFQRRAVPLVFMMLGILYGYIIGIVGAGIVAATYDLVTWLVPILMGFQILVTWRQYPVYYRILLKTFVIGGFVIATYGVVEYVNPPAWDAFWLLNAGMKTEGVPLPFSMRVASTMNSSAPFAVTMMVCLLMNFAARNKTAFLSSAVGVPALAGTMVRSAFGGICVGVVYLIIMLDSRSRLRVAVSLLVIALLCFPVALVDEFSEHVTARLETVTELGTDTSYMTRTGIYKEFIAKMATNIEGRGLGVAGLGAKLSDGSPRFINFDSGLMLVPYELGWPGALLYLGGVVILVYRAIVANLAMRHDRFAVASTAGAFSVLSMMFFEHTLAGGTGIYFFFGTLFPLAGLRYAREMQQANDKNARDEVVEI